MHEIHFQANMHCSIVSPSIKTPCWGPPPLWSDHCLITSTVTLDWSPLQGPLTSQPGQKFTYNQACPQRDSYFNIILSSIIITVSFPLDTHAQPLRRCTSLFQVSCISKFCSSQNSSQHGVRTVAACTLHNRQHEHLCLQPAWLLHKVPGILHWKCSAMCQGFTYCSISMQVYLCSQQAKICWHGGSSSTQQDAHRGWSSQSSRGNPHWRDIRPGQSCSTGAWGVLVSKRRS